MSSASIFSIQNVRKYPEDKTGWDVYSLLFGPIPILAHRNDNDYDVNEEWHSTFSWGPNNIRRSLPGILQLLRDYGALRHPKEGREAQLKRRLRGKLGPAIKTFADHIRAMNIRRNEISGRVIKDIRD